LFVTIICTVRSIQTIERPSKKYFSLKSIVWQLSASSRGFSKLIVIVIVIVIVVIVVVVVVVVVVIKIEINIIVIIDRNNYFRNNYFKKFKKL